MAGMKTTPLYEEHKRRGANFTEFAGYQMPLLYTSIKDESMAVRNVCGVFDISHMGRIWIEGPNTKLELNKLVTSNLASLEAGKAIYTLICNERGGIIDDLILYCNNDNMFFAVVNAARRDVDIQWLSEHLPDTVHISDISNESSLIAFQGPKASELLQKVVPDSVEFPRYFCHGMVSVNLDSNQNIEVFLARTGYTGEDGFEIVVDNDNAVRLWNKLLELGATPCGLGARDLLRLEAGLRLYGQDMDENTTPYEAGLGWTVNLDKDQFIGKDVLEQVKTEGPIRKLVGLVVSGKQIARHGNRVWKDEQDVGFITSGGYSFFLGKSIAMAYLPATIAKPGDNVFVNIRQGFVQSEVVRLPFYRGSAGKL